MTRLANPRGSVGDPVWIDADGTLHIDLEQLLQDSPFPDTPANRASLTKAAVRYAQEVWPAVSLQFADALANAEVRV